MCIYNNTNTVFVDWTCLMLIFVLQDEDSESNGQTVSVEKFENEVEVLREGIRDLSLRQDDMMDSVKAIKRLLLRMTGQGMWSLFV